MTARPAAAPTAVDLLVARRAAIGPFVVVGVACVVGGGLVAAVTGPTDFALGSWLAAFLILVGGVAQIALGLGQASLAEVAPRRRTVLAQAALWDLGLVATAAGSLLSTPALSTVGGLATMAALGLFLGGVRGAGAGRRGTLVLFRGVVAIVLVSVPIGLVLAWLWHG